MIGLLERVGTERGCGGALANDLSFRATFLVLLKGRPFGGERFFTFEEGSLGFSGVVGAVEAIGIRDSRVNVRTTCNARLRVR